MITLLSIDRERKWHHRMTGEWELRQEYYCYPDEPHVTHGHESVRLINGRWIMLQAVLGSFSRTRTLDYDPEKGLFVGTGFDSLSNHLWVHEAALDGDALTLETVGPEYPVGDEPFLPTREVIAFQGRDYRVSQLSVLRDGGEWQILMETHARRVG